MKRPRMKRRCVHVRIIPDQSNERGFQIVTARTRRPLGGVIPARYSEEFRKARAGHRIKGWIFSSDPPRIDPRTQNVLSEPVSFHVVSVEIPEAPA